MSTPFSVIDNQQHLFKQQQQQNSPNGLLTTGNSFNSAFDLPAFNDNGTSSLMEPPGTMNVPYEQNQPANHQQLYSRDVMLMNRKLAQLALLDANGNDNGTNNSPRNSTLDLGDGEHPSERPFVPFNSNNSQHHHNSLDSNQTHSQLPSLARSNYLSPLRRKLEALKSAQSTLQSNFLQSSAQYGQFALQLRHQLNSILQEVNDDLEGMFKARMLELAGAQATIEEAICRLEERANQKNNGLGNGENNHFNNKNGCSGGEVDDELLPADVDIIRQLLEAAVPGSGIRVPAADPVLSDRQMRALVLSLLKGTPVQANGVHPLEVEPANGVQLFGELGQQQQHGNNNNQICLPSAWNSLEGGLPNELNSIKGVGNRRPTPTYSAIAEQGNNFRTTVGGSNDLNSFQLQHPNSTSATNSSSTSLNHYQPQAGVTEGPNGRRRGDSGDGAQNGNGQQQNQKSLQPKLRRDRMSYVLKFGEQGAAYGQFAEPSGVAVNLATEDIYIADANNHRIQVFDRWGKFKYHFGEGRLKFPNRVALSAISGEVVVSERPPVHQIQVYDGVSGAFLVKFGAKHLRHPRGLTVDHRNRVVVVECKVMRVFVFSLRGDLLSSFDCASEIAFPNAVAVSKTEEIYISDNRSHCVKVFNFAGQCLRVLGGAGLTNYPIGVLLDERAGTLAVVDNYNNLNVTVFRASDGVVLAAFESSVKHQQCLDVAPFGGDGSTIVVTSKDLQVYIYRIKASPTGAEVVGLPLQQNQPTRRSFGSQASSGGASGLAGNNQYHAHHQMPSSSSASSSSTSYPHQLPLSTSSNGHSHSSPANNAITNSQNHHHFNQLQEQQGHPNSGKTQQSNYPTSSLHQNFF